MRTWAQASCVKSVSVLWGSARPAAGCHTTPEANATMTQLVLGRFELLEPIPVQAILYPGAEVWTAKDHQSESLRTMSSVKAILYPADSTHGTAIARALWSAEVRKLFRLSCQPFDPALVGFITGGFDAPTQRFALFMAESGLPSVMDWGANDEAGRACLKQWRGSQPAQRAQLWQHIASLFRAVGAIHESRIVHRRISPCHLLVDEGVPRDQSGFLKLGRFEASAFVSSFANTISKTPVSRSHPWYSISSGSAVLSQAVPVGAELTFGGDVFSALATSLWLLTGCPSDDEWHRFEQAWRSATPDERYSMRRARFATSIATLPTRAEQTFFGTLTKAAFGPGITSHAFYRRACEIADDLSRERRTRGGPLCFVLSDPVDRRLQQQWPDLFPSGSTAKTLASLCSHGLMWPAKDEQTEEMTNNEILLPNGLLLRCRIWRYPDGTKDWTRNYVTGVATYSRGTKPEPVCLADSIIEVLYQRERPPRTAASWEPLFEPRNANARDSQDPASRALEYLNKAELSFWEANIVPVKVSHASIRRMPNGERHECLDVVPLRDDDDFPPNPNIRGRPTPSFVQILQDKVPPIRVQLAPYSRLWDEATDRISFIEPTHVLTEADEEKQRIRLLRTLRAGDTTLTAGHRAYLVTMDQGWQMGLFRRRQRAMRSLAGHAILSTVLGNPRARSVSVVPPALRLDYERWNDEKSNLVSKALSVAPLFLVEGPPGTGKSTFVSGLMRYVLSRSEDPAARILVVAQQHSAIDDLHDRVQRMFASSEYEEADWGSPIMLRLSSRDQIYREGAAGGDADSSSVLSPPRAARTLLQPCLDHVRDRKEPEFVLLRQWLQTELGSVTISLALEQRLIDASSMIFTTCTDRYLDDISSTEFDWVIIEEAGRVVGCDLAIPMRLGHRWVLIGDPKQLGPYRRQDFDDAIKNTLQDAEKDSVLTVVERRRLETDCQRLLGPFESFYSELHNSSQRYSLTVQHRMHPEIRQIVSNVFYDGTLVDDPTTSGALPYLFGGADGVLAERAVVWVDMPHLHWPHTRSATADQKERHGFSFRNPSEVRVIQELIHHIAGYTERRNAGERIRLATITPYKWQLGELRRTLQECAATAPPWLDVEGAFTANAYQGREADMVILSMVRNNLAYDTGFLDQFLMNVALSRAHRMLVVVGCFKMFEHRADDPRSGEEFVRRLIDECRPYLVTAHDVFPEPAR